MTKYVDMLKEVYLHELENNVPEEQKKVMYIPELKLYKANNVSNDEIRSIYAKIMREKEQETEQDTNEYSGNVNETSKIENPEIPELSEPEEKQIQVIRKLNLKDSRIIVEKRLEKMNDRAKFSHKNIKNAISNYIGISVSKAIGYIYDDVVHYIMIKDIKDIHSRIEPCGDDAEQEFFYNYYQQLMCDVILQEEDIQIKTERDLAEKRAREEGLRINPKFKKEFLKKVRRNKRKLICNENFEAFDFRGVDISNIVFLYCNFNYANFTDLSIINTLFVRCECNGIVDEGTTYDNVEMIQCTREMEERDGR